MDNRGEALGPSSREEERKRFYLRAAERAKSLLAKSIFAELVKEEDKYILKIREIFARIREEKNRGGVDHLGRQALQAGEGLSGFLDEEGWFRILEALRFSLFTAI